MPRGRGRPKGISTLIKERAIKQEVIVGTKRNRPDPIQELEAGVRRGKRGRKPKNLDSDYCENGTDEDLIDVK